MWTVNNIKTYHNYYHELLLLLKVPKFAFLLYHLLEQTKPVATAENSIVLAAAGWPDFKALYDKRITGFEASVADLSTVCLKRLKNSA